MRIALQHRRHDLWPWVADELGDEKRRRIVHDGHALGQPHELLCGHARQQEQQRIRRQRALLRLEAGRRRHELEQDDGGVAGLVARVTLPAGRRYVEDQFRRGFRRGRDQGRQRDRRRVGGSLLALSLAVSCRKSSAVTATASPSASPGGGPPASVAAVAMFICMAAATERSQACRIA
jgi:hypothetical protein